MICTYNVRIDAWDRNTYFDKKRKQHQSPADDASTAETATGRVRRGEQGEAWRANSRPNVGSHLELGRLRLKTWSKSAFSIAQTTGQHICTCVHLYWYPLPALSQERERAPREAPPHSSGEQKKKTGAGILNLEWSTPFLKYEL